MKSSSRTSLFLYTALFQFAFAFYSYQTVYLQSVGFSASKIGLINALVYIAAMIFTTLTGIISDKLGSLKKVLIPVIIIGSLLYALVPLLPTDYSWSFVMFLFFLPICGMSRSAVFSMSDNLLVRGCRIGKFNFGLIRGSGSLTYALACLSMIFFVPYTGSGLTFPLLAVFSIPVLIILIRMQEPTEKIEHEKLNFNELFKNKPLVIFLLFMLIYNIAVYIQYDFMAVFMNKIGLDTSYFGLINCLTASMEFPMLAIVSRLKKRFSLQGLCIFSAAIEALGMFLLPRFGTTMLTLCLIQIIFGFACGLQIGTASNHINRLAPPKLQATAAALLTLMTCIAGFAANLSAGILIDRFSYTFLYNATSLLILLGIGFYLIAMTILKRRPGND